jgi:Rrf2 family protein
LLSKKTKYAIHALVNLSKKKGDGPVLISSISKEEKIPQKFLEAILLDLRKSGFLGSKKGKGGGYYIIKSPENIFLTDVIRLFDGAIALLPCVSLNYYETCTECEDELTCGLKKVFEELRDRTLDLLKNTSIQHIIENENHLKNITTN